MDKSKSKLDMSKIRETLAKTRIIPTEINDQLSTSFIGYAMAVNVSRAIPDVRDGLKPVHRRILFAMNEIGNTYDKPTKKCARIVGEVLGKFHPHGDSSVYDALVRLGQSFSIRTPLVDGQGNFGSVDGDPPAAMRYTEARLSKIAGEMLKDIDKETVDFYPNFDDTLMQPRVLPARFPNLLVNGSEGIAVGMATSIPPHNLGEVIDGTIALMDNPDIAVEELMKYIPAPDYPTGGIIIAKNAMREAYLTGKGSVTIRSKCEIEEVNGKNRIIVHEIPYQVNKSVLLKTIADQVKDKRLEGISDLRDESDRFGMRIVIELKRDAQATVVLNNLYKQTDLQVSNGITMLALVNGVPKVLNLKEVLYYYLEHQKEVITRRTRYLLAKAMERDHILRGYAIALANIDEVIAVIKASPERQTAMQNLMDKFTLSDKQAAAILDMKLARLTHLEVEKITEELNAIELAIQDYNDILAKPERVCEIIKNELSEIRNEYDSKRLSEISYDLSDIDMADLIEQEDVVILMTYRGYIKRESLTEYKAQNRGGLGVTAHKAKDEDFVNKMFICNTHEDLLFFSNRGKVFRLKAYEVPEASKQSKGRAIINLLPLMENEKITAFLSVKDYENGYMIMATKNGLVKKCDISEFESIRANGKIAITLSEDDELIVAETTTGNNELLMASSTGKCIRFSEEDVRKTGRGSQGVRSIKIDEGERVVDMAIIREGEEVITVTQNGYGKRSDIDEYRLQSRAGKGIKAGNFTEKTGDLVNLKLVSPDYDIILIADNGIMIRIAASMISKIGRNTQGVKLMRLKEGSKVEAVALTPHEEDVEYDQIDGEIAEGEGVEESEKNNEIETTTEQKIEE